MGTEEAFRPSTSKPERGSSGLWFLLAAAIFVIGSLGAVYLFSGDGPSPASNQECDEALDAADDLIGLATDSLELVADAFQALSVLDLERVEDIAAELDAERARELRAVYDQAAGECRD